MKLCPTCGGLMLTVDSAVGVMGQTVDLLRCDLCEHEETRPSNDDALLEDDRRELLADGGQLKLGETQMRLDEDVQDAGDEDPVDVDDLDVAPAPPKPDETEGLIYQEYGPDPDPNQCVAGAEDCAGARSLPWGELPCIACFVLADQELIDAYNEAKPSHSPVVHRSIECDSCGELSATVYRCSECGTDFATDTSTHGQRGA